MTLLGPGEDPKAELELILLCPNPAAHVILNDMHFDATALNISCFSRDAMLTVIFQVRFRIMVGTLTYNMHNDYEELEKVDKGKARPRRVTVQPR